MTLVLTGHAMNMVDQGWNTFSNLAVQAFGDAAGYASDLGNFNIEPVQHNLAFTPPPGSGLVWNRPDKPDDPDTEFSVTLPEPLSISVPNMPNFGSAPQNTASLDSLDFSGQPGPPNFGDPPGPPTLDSVNLPPTPNITLPPDPQLTDLNLPSPPPLLSVDFLGERPDAPDEHLIPEANIDFTEETYDSDLLDRTRQEITRMMDDGTGMPVIIEQMLVDRFRQRHDREATRAVQTAFEETASRGFNLPQGTTLRRAQEARQNNQNQNAEASRDVFIQRRTEETENLRFAVSQGIALENMLINAHLNVMQRAFDFARAVADLRFRKLEASIAIYNAAIQGYQADAAVYESMIRAEAQKLERYRLQIQAEALKQEIDKNKVAIYNARIEGLRQVVQIYVAQVEAARAIADKNNAEVRAYVGQIEGFRARIEGRKAEFEAWATKVRGQLGKVQAYEAETRAFLAEVQAYDTETRALSLQPQIGVQIEELRIREAMAKIEAARTEIQAEGARVNAEAAVYGSKASMYSADGQMAAQESAAHDRMFNSALESSRLQAVQLTEDTKLNVEQLLRSAQIISGALDAAGRIQGQLAAGAMSAVSMSAGSTYSEQINASKELD